MGTTIHGTGEIELGDHNLNVITIKDVKEMVYKLHGEIMPIESQDLWWKGYKLSRDDLTLQRACIGVNGEKLDETPESLKIFVIVRDIMHNKTKDKSYNERSS